MVEGYHVSVFAYGQTATGKTFTIKGNSGESKRFLNRGVSFNEDKGKQEQEKSRNTEGIIQLAIQDCSEYIYNQKNETREYFLRVSFMEIYNEIINDLLASPSRSQPIRTNIDVRVICDAHDAAASIGHLDI
mmetsp:Transcript_2131/g.3193  ORF Transcript_2131/g.3193 Transcript_2131/m.3193 type:complete len:132 (-) Transcript_2131:210-605(-)